MTCALVVIEDGHCYLGSDSQVTAQGYTYHQKITIIGEWAIAVAGGFACWSWLQYDNEIRNIIREIDTPQGLRKVVKMWKEEGNTDDCQFIFARCGKAWLVQSCGVIEPIHTSCCIGHEVAPTAAYNALRKYSPLSIQDALKASLEATSTVSAYCGGEIVVYDCSGTPKRI